jgi:hypothetical protein
MPWQHPFASFAKNFVPFAVKIFPPVISLACSFPAMSAREQVCVQAGDPLSEVSNSMFSSVCGIK